MNLKSLLPVLLAPLLVLLIPLLGTFVSEEWQWRVGDFLFAYMMMASVGLAYKFVTRRAGSIAYRLATAVALGTAFLILWGNLAVGFIGSEDNPSNLLYGGVILIGVVGAALARCTAVGLARAMFTTALAQFLVPILAWLTRPADFAPGITQVFALNFGFVLMFAVSGLLFRHAARTSSRTGLGAVA